MDIKNPYEMSFFHVYELDENGSILQELDPKDFWTTKTYKNVGLIFLILLIIYDRNRHIYGKHG